MSTQTGIRASADLNALFGRCRDGHLRMMRIIIDKERLELDKAVSSHASGNDWRRDWANIVPGAVVPNQPCFLLFRLDERDASGHFLWVLVSWSPDSASVRLKMLYASTKATLRKEFGPSQIKDDLYANVQDDITLEGYDRHIRSHLAPGPLSQAELERAEVLAASHHGVNSRHSLHSPSQQSAGLAFPMNQGATEALRDLVQAKCNYVRLKIDTAKEEVQLDDKSNINVPVGNHLPSKVPLNHPAYHVVRVPWNATDIDHANGPLFFVYSMPSEGGCSIKEKMIYSSCKRGVIEACTQLGIDLHKRIEIDSPDELNEDALMRELQAPSAHNNRPQKFAKPAPPGNRGPRRVINKQQS